MLANIPKGGSFWNVAPNYNDFKYHVFILAGNETLYYVFNAIVVCSIIMLVLNKRYKFYQENFNTNYYILFLCLYVLPIALDFCIAQYTPVFLSRYILYSTFGLFLLIAYVISSLNTKPAVRMVLFSPLLILLMYSFKFKQEKEDDWKTIIPAIKNAKTSNAVILISASYKFRDFSLYYDIEAFKDYNKTIERLAKSGVYCSPTDEWFGWNKLNFDTINKIIYVQSHSQFEDPEGKIKEFILNNHFKVCDHYERINIAYTIYVRDTMDCFPLKVLNVEPPAGCDEYQKTIAINEQTNDTVLIYRNNMEPFTNCALSETITDEKLKSGKYSSRINEQNQYSVSFVRQLKQLNGFKKVTASAFVNYEPESKGRLVISVERGNETLCRSETAVTEDFKSPGVWGKITGSLIIPSDIPEDAELKIYFWNPSVGKVYIDDLEIVLEED
ncbi:MAG: hypothetical protein H0W84_01730 [Bacteroidetes bacterium]|nr:hypothetical protein [Bacteroidota bacterium]